MRTAVSAASHCAAGSTTDVLLGSGCSRSAVLPSGPFAEIDHDHQVQWGAFQDFVYCFSFLKNIIPPPPVSSPPPPLSTLTGRGGGRHLAHEQ